MTWLTRTFAILLMLAAVSGPHSAHGQILGTKHNLSASGPGPIKAYGENEICIFCHTPHSSTASTPLWNRVLPTLVYTPYSSSTLEASTGQPTSSSKLCLSCHDGTIGLGMVLSRSTPISVTSELSGRAKLTTDLSDDHPVSFVYDAALAAADAQLVDPGLLPKSVRLDPDGQMQCTSCHDPHSDRYGKFLVMDNIFSALCTTCHDKTGWVGSLHATSPATWDGSGIDPWPYTSWTTVAENACLSCHTSHMAGSPEWLLTQVLEEDTCLACHDGSTATQNIDTEIRKPYRHPVDSYSGVHEPNEDPLLMPRHVECQDCHNPHAVRSTTASAPNASGALDEVPGISSAGGTVDPAAYQYEVCFRCHADSVGVPAPNIQRAILEPNIRLKFDLSNPSYHPVEGPGQNSSVPSLISPLTTSSVIYCTDCHANDSGPGAGGGGPAGPHGSNWQYLLEREYRTADNTSESYQAYSLCYKCHSRNSILGDQSFKEHDKHIRGEKAPCSICHDPHGISITQGTTINNTHLINFDTSIVQADPTTGRLEFQDDGTRKGRCYLRCHGKSHSPKTY